MSNTILLPFQPESMTRARVAAVSYLARYSGHTHSLYAYQLRRWFQWCETNRLDPLDGIQRAHIELYIRHLGGCGLMPSSINTMMHGIRGFFRFAHIDGLVPSDPAVYARLPKIHQDESRTQGLDRLELIRILQVAQTITVHHGALAYLLGINALRASEAAAVRIEDYRDTLRGHRVLHLVGKGTKPATMPLTVPVLRVLEACRGERTECRCAMLRSWPGTPTHAPPSTTTAPAETPTATASTSLPPTSPARELPSPSANLAAKGCILGAHLALVTGPAGPATAANGYRSTLPRRPCSAAHR
jgi:integrase